jgi:Tfp pilus assembly protein PilO
MTVWTWQLRQWARRLGAGGLIGLGLLVAALLLHVFQVESLQRTIRAQQANVVALRQAALRREATPAAAPLNPLALLPPTGEASQLIGELERLARAHGLALPRGQYSVSPLAGTSLQRWQLVLPVEGPYPALHAFLAAALERLPNLTLDELKLKRDRIESTQLQAELRLSLFVEASP